MAWAEHGNLSLIRIKTATGTSNQASGLNQPWNRFAPMAENSYPKIFLSSNDTPSLIMWNAALVSLLASALVATAPFDFDFFLS